MMKQLLSLLIRLSSLSFFSFALEIRKSIKSATKTSSEQIFDGSSAPSSKSSSKSSVTELVTLNDPIMGSREQTTAEQSSARREMAEVDGTPPAPEKEDDVGEAFEEEERKRTGFEEEESPLNPEVRETIVEKVVPQKREYQYDSLFNGLLKDVVVGANGVWTVWRGDDAVQSAAPYMAPTGAGGTSALETAKERVLEEQKHLCDWTESHARAGYGFEQDQSFQICTSKDQSFLSDVVKRERYGWHDCDALPNLFQKNLPAGGKGGEKWFYIKIFGVEILNRVPQLRIFVCLSVLWVFQECIWLAMDLSLAGIHRTGLSRIRLLPRIGFARFSTGRHRLAGAWRLSQTSTPAPT